MGALPAGVLKSRRALRERLTALLQAGDFPGLVDLAGREPGVASQLLMFLYTPNEELHWRALEGLGQVAGAYPQQVRRVMDRLLWLLNEDSGSFGWGAAAALGEIGRHQVSLVAEIIPMFCGFLEQEFSRGPMLWGIGRLGEVHPELLGEVLPLVAELLDDGDPQVRGLAAWCLGKSHYRPAAAALRKLRSDDLPAAIYDRGELKTTPVGQVAREALEALEEEPKRS
jgi:hypothetical protein